MNSFAVRPICSGIIASASQQNAGVNKISSRDDDARFKSVVLPHLADAYCLARWLTGNRADAEDVVQDACLKALGAMETAVVEQPRAWMLAIVRNTAFTWLKKNRPKSVLITDDSELIEAAAAKTPNDATPNPEE